MLRARRSQYPAVMRVRPASTNDFPAARERRCCARWPWVVGELRSLARARDRSAHCPRARAPLFSPRWKPDVRTLFSSLSRWPHPARSAAGAGVMRGRPLQIRRCAACTPGAQRRARADGSRRGSATDAILGSADNSNAILSESRGARHNRNSLRDLLRSTERRCHYRRRAAIASIS